jgi:hypothetical protein
MRYRRHMRTVKNVAPSEQDKEEIPFGELSEMDPFQSGT